MIKNLPEGTSIGEMRASLQWILSHTARFAGLVLVTIQGSRGFILINMGKPLAYYFRHGQNVLNGHAAYEYFQSQPFIQFELRKYTPLEMTLALGLASATEVPAVQTISGKQTKGIVKGLSGPSAEPSPGETTSDNSAPEVPRSAGEDSLSSYETAPTENSTSANDTIPYIGVPQNFTLSGDDENDLSLFPHVPLRTIGKLLDSKKTDVGDLILGQIINLPGVLAVTIFGRGINVLSIGEINPENLVDVAEDLIKRLKRTIIRHANRAVYPGDTPDPRW